MVRGPGVPGGALCVQLVINNDLAPTIADLAGATVPAFVDGRSFTPLLTSTPPSSWRHAFLHEGWLPAAPPVPTNKGVRTQRHTFVEYDTGERELYDLAADPYQLESLPQAGNEQLYSEMQARLDGLKDCTGAQCRAAEWDDDITSSPADIKSPRVASTVPGSNARAVAPSANPTATFSEVMDSGTINVTTFKLLRRGSTTGLPAAISYSTSTDMAMLDPTNSLRAGVTYKAVVTTGAKDQAGNPLDQNTTTTGLQQKAWFFTVSN